MKKALVAGILTAALAGTLMAGTVMADEIAWPEKTITFVCPFSAGGDTDFNCRTLGKYLEDELGVTINVVNTTGGGGSIASTEVKDTEADGYTFLTFDTAMALNEAFGVTDFGFEAFDPVALYAKSTGEFVVVRSDYPVETLDELVAYSQEHPEEVNFAANTGATSYYVATKLKEAGAEFNVVNAGSSSERVASLMGENIDVSNNAMGVIAQYIETGDLKILANLSEEVPEAYPDYPLAKDQGIDIGYNLKYNVMAPKGTDPAIIEKLAAAIENIVSNNEDYATEIKEAYGQTPFIAIGDEMMEQLQAEKDQYMAYADVFQAAAE